jgi:hypothetical protein
MVFCRPVRTTLYSTLGSHDGEYIPHLPSCILMFKAKMSVALCSIGGWMYFDVPATPKAVVVGVMCVFAPLEASQVWRHSTVYTTLRSAIAGVLSHGFTLLR